MAAAGPSELQPLTIWVQVPVRGAHQPAVEAALLAALPFGAALGPGPSPRGRLRFRRQLNGVYHASVALQLTPAQLEAALAFVQPDGSLPLAATWRGGPADVWVDGALVGVRPVRTWGWPPSATAAGVLAALLQARPGAIRSVQPVYADAAYTRAGAFLVWLAPGARMLPAQLTLPSRHGRDPAASIQCRAWDDPAAVLRQCTTHQRWQPAAFMPPASYQRRAAAAAAPAPEEPPPPAPAPPPQPSSPRRSAGPSQPADDGAAPAPVPPADAAAPAHPGGGRVASLVQRYSGVGGAAGAGPSSAGGPALRAAAVAAAGGTVVASTGASAAGSAASSQSSESVHEPPLKRRLGGATAPVPLGRGLLGSGAQRMMQLSERRKRVQVVVAPQR